MSFDPRILQFDHRRLAATVIFITALCLSAADLSAQDDVEAPDAVAIFNSGQDLHEKGDLAAAIKLYDQALKIIPEFPEAVYQRGLAELALGDRTAAEASLRKAVEIRPDWSLALSSLGSLLVSLNKFDEAERILNKAIELDTQNFPALAAMTELRLKTKAPDTVLRELLVKMSAITAKANPPTSAWLARAALQKALRQPRDARLSVNKVLSVEPANKFALSQSAEIALSSGDAQRAEADTKQLEKIAPNDETTMLLRAKIFLGDGNTKEALEILNNPILARSQEALDLRKLIETNGSVSATDLEKQLVSEPENVVLLGRLCRLYRKADPLKSLDYCRRASEAEPENIDHAVGFGAALVQAKQFESASNLLGKLATIAPDNSTIRANLGTVLFQLKRYSEAKIQFEWLVTSQPRSAAAYLFLGIIHDRLGEHLDAMANYQQYIRLADPVENKLDVERVNLRLPELQRLMKKK